MKKRISIVTIVALLLAFSTGVIANTVYETIKAQVRPDFKVVIDGEQKSLKSASGERVYPILHEGTTYLPIRAISEIIGKKVYWYENDKRIEITDATNQSTVTDADVIITGDSSKENTDNTTDYITKDKAREIAAEKAGYKVSDISYIKAELDYENGVAVYEVEFTKSGKEYSADIRATDGKILDWEVDIDD